MSKKNEGFIPLYELDEQEGLSSDRIRELTADAIFDLPQRPKDSYIELLNWVEDNFAGALALKSVGDKIINPRINRFIHNKIIIDGQFIEFCKTKKINIKPLYNDAIVSWKSEYDNEKFFMQGVFLIESKNVKFIHFALFQKGNQHEDEISFGILVDNSNYDNYIIIRNEFEDWISKRDRSNLQIRVVDGEDIPYERDCKWEDIFLPEELKSSIKLTVEGFLNSRDIYESQKIPWKRGLLLWGVAGNGKTSLIKTIISNYDFKPITVLPSANDDAMREAFAYAEEQNPALLFFEDLDSLLQNINISLFLNLLDGISTKNGVFIVATANSLENFASNIKDRPSRFDRKFEIPLPNQEMSIKYLKKWFNKTIPDKEINRLALFASNNKFSYAYIKELYISSVYIAISNDRKQPTLVDIDLAMEQLMMDKFRKNTKTIGIDKYIDKNKNKK